MTPVSARVFRLLPLVFAAVALAACETTGTGAPDAAAKPVELPMTHTRAAEQCWMSTEKGAASMSLDKRADMVDKCIAEKMKTGTAEPAPETKKPEAKKPETKKPETKKPETKKKKPDAAAEAKKKQPAAGEEKGDKTEKDKKPEAEAPDKKP